jgi:hypothetical protein
MEILVREETPEDIPASHDARYRDEFSMVS